jgi:hypothetical protein
MRAQFIRGGLETRKDILDRVLNRVFTVQLDAHNVHLNDKGKMVKGHDDDTDYFIDNLKKSGAKWKILDTKYPVSFEFTGTKEQLIPVLYMWDAYSRPIEAFAEAMKDWDGSDDQLTDIMF